MTLSGGIQGILQKDTSDYICDIVEQRFGYDLTVAAAHYLSRISKAHQFVDANKRTAYFSTRYFLMLNGMDFNGDSIENAAHQLTDISKAPTLDRSYELAFNMIEKDILQTEVTTQSYKDFYRLVLKSIGIANKLSKM